MKTFQQKLKNKSEIGLWKVFPVSTQAVTALVMEKLEIVNGCECLI